MSLDSLRASLADRYAIERELGEGGMATVYLAQDLKHDRRVALKVLKPELAAVIGAERFVVEIKTTAALSHPHILPLFDSGTADSFLYYVMPFIDGETLRDKLNRERQFAVEDAVRITCEVAEALHYAHGQGVVHRDIKPENILLANGRPMVADFGIALALSAAAGGRMTETGLSLGTPHYMSPEQATAEKEISARSDVYSLASVLYEMLTGDPPHTGSSAQQVIMKIISETADPVTTYRKAVPPNVAAAVGKALEKLPADRFESAEAFKNALSNPAFTTATASAMALHPTTARGWIRSPLSWAAMVCLAAVTGALVWTNGGPEPIQLVPRLDLSLGEVELAAAGQDIAISPDGSMLAFGGRQGEQEGIFLRRLERDAEFTMVQGSEGGRDPSFSPDNQWIVFARRRDSTLVKVMVGGGGAVQVVRGDSGSLVRPHWGTEGQIAYLTNTFNGTIFLVDATGSGVPRLLGRVTASGQPFLLPDGSAVLATNLEQVLLFPTNGDSARPLIPNGRFGRYVEPGYLLYIDAGGGLFAQRFDPKRGAVKGSAIRVLDRVAATRNRSGFAVSRGGTLVHLEGEGATATGFTATTTLLTVSFAGAVDSQPLPAAFRAAPKISPDGRSVAYMIISASSRRSFRQDLYVYDLVNNANNQMTFDGSSGPPIWSPDGTELLFTSLDSAAADPSPNLFVMPADNSRERRLVAALPGQQVPTDWPALDTVVFEAGSTNNFDLHLLSLADSAEPSAYLEAPWNEEQLQVAPGGRFATFVSGRGGQPEVYVRDYPVPSGEWKLSGDGGGTDPRWAPDGKSVYFWRDPGFGVADTLYQATFDPTASVPVQSVRPVPGVPAIDLAGWDIHPDGDRFVAAANQRRVASATSDDGTAAPRYIVTLNWFKDLEAKMAAAKGQP